MKFSVVSLLAAASSAVAQLPPTAGFDAIVVPTAGQTLTPGGSLDITWQPNGVKGTITIHLLQGAASNLLEDGGVVAAAVDNSLGHFVWKPIPQGKFAAYGFNITLDQDPLTYQLSNGFHIAQGAGSYPTSTSSSSAAAGGYPTSSASAISIPSGYSVSSVAYTQTSVVTLVSVTSYGQSSSTSCTTSPVVVPTYPASNATWVKPPTTAYPTTVLSTPSGPVSSPSSPPTQGAATRFGASGLAAFGAVLLAALVL